MNVKLMIIKLSLAFCVIGSFGTSFAAEQTVSYNNCTFNIGVSTIERDPNKRKRSDEQAENLSPAKRARLQRFAPANPPISEEVKEKARIFLESIAAEYDLGKTNSEGDELNSRGLDYELGRGVPLNPSMAFECYKMSAAKNHSYGQLNLGLCYYEGLGTTIDDKEARYHILQAVKQGNPSAVFIVGQLCEKGVVFSQSDSYAIKFYNLATKLGSPVAEYNLGRCYEYGIGVERNLWKALCHYQEAAHQNDIDALFRVGNFYQFGIDKDGIRLRKNLRAAKSYYQKGRDEEERLERDARSF